MNLTEKQIEDHKAWLQDQKPAIQGFVGTQLCDAALAKMSTPEHPPAKTAGKGE